MFCGSVRMFAFGPQFSTFYGLVIIHYMIMINLIDLPEDVCSFFPFCLTTIHPGREIFWRHDLVYFDNVRIASSVLTIGGGLITALPTRLYEVSGRLF